MGQSGQERRLEAAWRSLRSIKHDINNGYYEWALIKSYKASESALCALLDMDLDAYNVRRLTELYKMVSTVCSGDDNVEKCVRYVEDMYTVCFSLDEPGAKCDLNTSITSFRCSKAIISWAQNCYSTP